MRVFFKNQPRVFETVKRKKPKKGKKGKGRGHIILVPQDEGGGGVDAFTTLLIHSDTTDGDTTFTDSSPSGHIMTVGEGTPVHKDAQSRFGATSMFWNNASRIDLPESDDFVFDGDFTIDAWIYPIAAGALLISNITSANYFHSLYLSSTTLGRVYIDSTLELSFAVTPNEWQHYALVREGDVFKAYINGTLMDTETIIGAGSVNLPANNVYGSAVSAQRGDGYVDELRVSKGIARWTEDFLPPTAPYPEEYDEEVGPTGPDANTVLLVHGDGLNGSVDFLDSSDTGAIVTPTSAQHDDAVAKFGDTSIELTGGGYLAVAHDDAQKSNGGAYTIDFWVNFHSGGDQIFAGKNQGSTPYAGWYIKINQSEQIMFINKTNDSILFSSAGKDPNVWTHIAIVCDGVDSYMYVDGILESTALGETITDYSAPLCIGRMATNFASDPSNAHIEEFRLSKVARWTGEFVPPREPYPIPVRDTVTAKSVIFDILNTWGGGYSSIRSIEFLLRGVVIPVTSGFTADATTEHSSPYIPENAFNTSLSRIDTHADRSWHSSSVLSGELNRLLVVFDTPIEFDQIVINNGHSEGAATNRGAKDTVITISSDEITDTTYGAAITNSTVLFDGQLSIHPSVDVPDNQTYYLGEE